MNFIDQTYINKNYENIQIDIQIRLFVIVSLIAFLNFCFLRYTLNSSFYFQKDFVLSVYFTIMLTLNLLLSSKYNLLKHSSSTFNQITQQSLLGE